MAFILCCPVRQVFLPSPLPLTVAWWGAHPFPALHGETLSDSDQFGAFEISYWQIRAEEEQGKIVERPLLSGKEFSLKERG